MKLDSVSGNEELLKDDFRERDFFLLICLSMISSIVDLTCILNFSGFTCGCKFAGTHNRLLLLEVSRLTEFEGEPESEPDCWFVRSIDDADADAEADGEGDTDNGVAAREREGDGCFKECSVPVASEASKKESGSSNSEGLAGEIGDTREVALAFALAGWFLENVWDKRFEG